MATSSRPDAIDLAGSQEKGPTSLAGGVSLLRAIMLALTVVVGVAVPTLLLVRFHGHPMSQVWILSLSICSDVFLFLMFIHRSRRLYAEFSRLSYGPLLAFFSASAIGSATATYVDLVFSMLWAAGNLGYSLAVHRLREGTELAIHTVSSHYCPTNDTVKDLSSGLHVAVPVLVLLSALFVALPQWVVMVTDELDILMALSYCGWMHAAAWLIIVSFGSMKEYPLKVPVEWLQSGLFPCLVMCSPVICFVSQILAALFHLLLMLALFAFLWYNVAIYIHFETPTPRYTTARWNEDHLHSKILEDKAGMVNSDPKLGTASSSAAATLGNEDGFLYLDQLV